MNKLNLIRPIAFFDLETTGTDVEKDFIVSINIIKIMPGGEVEKKGALLNPGIPIPEGASSVHGITDEMVKDAPTFKQYSRGILGFLDRCDLGGFNLLKFDVPLLFNEFERSGISWDLSTIHIVDAGNIYKIQEPRTLSAAYKFYTGHVLEDAHEAEADNMAAIEVFMAQLAMYPDLPANVAELAEFSNFGKKRADVGGKFSIDADGDYIFNFGKNLNKKAKTEMSYLYWMIEGNFNSDTKRICRLILEENLPDRIKNQNTNLFNS